MNEREQTNLIACLHEARREMARARNNVRSWEHRLKDAEVEVRSQTIVIGKSQAERDIEYAAALARSNEYQSVLTHSLRARAELEDAMAGLESLLDQYRIWKYAVLDRLAQAGQPAIVAAGEVVD